MTSRRPCVAVVDDDASFRDALSGLLRAMDFDVCAFASAAAYLEGGRACGAACLMLDVNMPGMSGLELQDRLKDDGFAVPIIFITSQTDASVRDRALSGGAVAVMEKPFDQRVLMAIIARALDMAH
ncbi:MAG: response regulator [Alphaproteobacteria bacterium]|nr:response regulator [Alphaproteobacteria bacterium]